VESGRFRIVERPVDTILEELHLNQKDDIALEDRNHAGRLVGAKYITFGDCAVFEDFISITARFVTTETGLLKIEKTVEGKPGDAASLAAQLAAILTTGLQP